MSLIVTSLASGSSGNAFLVQAGRDLLLIEAGISVRATERHLRERDIDPASLRAIVVSHEHHDHAQSAGALARRYSVPILCSDGTAKVMAAEWSDIEIRRPLAPSSCRTSIMIMRRVPDRWRGVTVYPLSAAVGRRRS